MKLVIATKNKNKLKEIKDKFSEIKDLEIVSLTDYKDSPDVVEDGETFEENALKKAREISIFTGLPALADDSGLVVDALGGRPGVYSARYGGGDIGDTDRSRLILEELIEVPEDKRSARFICLIAIVMPDGSEYIAKGACEGKITKEMKGTNGFGYDPIFGIPGSGKTMAEISLTEKNKISHRAIALDEALVILRKVFTS